MIGLKLPRLFYGRKKRQSIIGTRAEFCEFCVCVCRHHLISFQSAQTMMFVPSAFEEYDRESRCEICRTQFPVSLNKPFQKTTDDSSISKLIETTNPSVIEDATLEVVSMVERSDDFSVLEKNKIINFLRSHESEYHRKLRSFVPLIAIGSIQAVIVGLVLSVFVNLWLALSFVSSVYVLVSLAFFILLRQKAFQSFSNGAIRLKAITKLDYDKLVEAVVSLRERFPKAVAITCKQIELAKQDETIDFDEGKDFISMIDKAVERRIEMQESDPSA